MARTTLRAIWAAAAVVAMLAVGCASSTGVLGKRVGEGERLEFVAPADGHVYVRDSAKDTLVVDTDVQKGTRVEVDAQTGRVSIGDERRQLPSDGLRTGVSYQLFFKEREHREYHPMMTP